MIFRQLAENIEQDSSKDLEEQIFTPVMSHAAATPFNACWKPDLEGTSKAKSPTKSNQLILYLRIVTHSSVWLSLSSFSYITDIIRFASVYQSKMDRLSTTPKRSRIKTELVQPVQSM